MYLSFELKILTTTHKEKDQCWTIVVVDVFNIIIDDDSAKRSGNKDNDHPLKDMIKGQGDRQKKPTQNGTRTPKNCRIHTTCRRDGILRRTRTNSIK